MSFDEYKERISEGDTVILFLVSVILFSDVSLSYACWNPIFARAQHVLD